MRTSGGRSAALLLVALPLSGLLIAGCSGAAEPEVRVAPGPTSGCPGPGQEVGVPSYGPSGYVGDMPGDMPPNYAANHAFQQRMRLCGDDLGLAAAEAVRAKEVLDRLADTGAPSVERALAGLGYRPDHLTVTSGAPTTFVVEVAGEQGRSPFCLDGTVGPDGAAVEVDGIYSEGGCIKPVGGH